MPRTGPTLCHPKIGYVDLSVNTLSTLVPFSPLVHTWRQRRLSPKYQIQNYTVTLNTIPQTSSNTCCHLNIPLCHFVSNTNKPKLHESCSTKSKPYSMLQIKNFLCCVVKEKFCYTFVLPKIYSVREINNFPKHYRPKYLLNFNFISGFNNHSMGRRSSRIQMKWSRLLEKAFKYIRRFGWLISPKSLLSCPMVFFMMLVSACRLASNWHKLLVKPQD